MSAILIVEVMPRLELPSYEPVYLVRADLELVSARVEAFEGCLRQVLDTPRHARR